MRHYLLATALILGASSAMAGSHAVPGAHFIENWDMDGNGEVSAAETAEKRAQIFAMFDQDENGVLDSAEYDLFDATRKADIEANAGGGKGPMAKVDTAMSRDFNDLNSDGAVSQAEFSDRSDTFFKMIDRDSSGAITSADFRPGG